MGTVRELVKKLTEITKQNKLQWNGSDILGYSCEYKNWKLDVSWLQDDKPAIFINDAVLCSYGYGIEDLLSAVRSQGQFIRSQSKMVVKDIGPDNFNRMAKVMLQRLNSGKRRKR